MATPKRPIAPRPRIAVLGAGIVGASIAYHLARAGAKVTLVDGGRPGEGVTGRAFGWINVFHGESAAYRGLRRRALEAYHRLDEELEGRLPLTWRGAITWLAEPERTADLVQSCEGLRLLEREEVRRLEPLWRNPPACAAFAEAEGAIEPAQATRTLVSAACAAGARLLTGRRCEAITTAGSAITGLQLSGGPVAADGVVLAAGAASPALLAPLGLRLPVSASPAMLLRFRTPRPLVSRILSTPEAEIRQVSPSLMVGAEDYREEEDEDDARARAEAALSALRTGLQGGEAITLESHQVGWRPMLADGLPLFGALPGWAGLSLAVMHAGVTLAPLVGQVLSREILDGDRDRQLDRYRPKRLSGPPRGSSFSASSA